MVGARRRDAEVDQREPLGRAALDLVDRRVPGLDVDVGRRRRPGGRSATAGCGRRTRRPRAACRRGSSRRGARRGPGVGNASQPSDVAVGDRGCSPPAPARARPRARRTRRRRAGAPSARAATGRRGAARRPPRPRPSARDARARSSRPRPRGRGGCARAAGGGCRVSSSPRSRRPSFSRGSVVAGPQSKSAGPSVGLEQVDADRALEAAEEEVDRLERLHGAQPGAATRDERRLEVGEQVVDRLDPDREPHEVRAARRTARRRSRRASSAPGARSGSRRRRATRRAGRASSAPTSATASSSDSARNETIPPKSRICRARDLVARDATAGRGRARARPPGGRRGTRRSRARSRSAGASGPRAS